MTDELLRAVVGLPIAALWPRGVPVLGGSRARAGVAAALTAALVLAPVFPDWQAWLLLAATGAAAAALPPDADAPPLPRVAPGVLAFAGIAALAAVVLGFDTARRALGDGAESDDVVFVLVGALAATFLAGHVVGFVLAPLDAPPGMRAAGRAIGWLERALVFGFLLAGEPGAAALALTAKSVARFPAFAADDGHYAEYVLIGTLLSFTLVTAIAIGTRALLGLPVL